MADGHDIPGFAAFGPTPLNQATLPARVDRPKLAAAPGRFLPRGPAVTPDPATADADPDARCRRVLAALVRAGYVPIDAADWKNHGIAVVGFAWQLLGRWADADADADELEACCALVEAGYLPPGQPGWEARADAIRADARFLLRRVTVDT